MWFSCLFTTWSSLWSMYKKKIKCGLYLYLPWSVYCMQVHLWKQFIFTYMIFQFAPPSHISDKPTASIGGAFSPSCLAVIPQLPLCGLHFCWALLLIHHQDFFRDLLLRVRQIWQLVQVLDVVEALSNTLGCQTSLWVVVPALFYGGTHHLDALQGEQWSTNLISQYWLRLATPTAEATTLSLCVSLRVFLHVC